MAQILIIDDAASIRKILTYVFEKNGHEVHTYKNSAQAISVLKEQAFDAIIVDLIMPEGSGWDLLEFLQDHGAHESTSTFVLSSLNDRKTRLKALQMGIRDFITKPFEPEEILTKVENAIALNQTRANGIQGNVGALPLSELLQALVTSKQTGIIDLDFEQQSGTISLSDGNIVHAHYGQLSGKNALEHLLYANAGYFDFRKTEIDSSKAQPMNLQNILFDSAWMEDELNKRKADLPSLDTKLKTGPWQDAVSGFETLPLKAIYQAVKTAKTLSQRDLIHREPFSQLRIQLSIGILMEQGTLVKA